MIDERVECLKAVLVKGQRVAVPRGGHAEILGVLEGLAPQQRQV